MGMLTKFWQICERNKLLSREIVHHHYSLYPILICIVGGSAWAAIFSARTIIFNPDSTFLGRDSYERYRNGKDFKVFNITGLTLPCVAPQYRREGDPPDDSYALPDY